mmetsp:Transcript_41502/g.117537  ORF Transcript_41502/g.117537 Transcript_41502/m.117537 type:complete len:271 (-) Transcript_41502:376-1188(-)
MSYESYSDFWQQPMLAEFKAWYTSVDGFGDYLRHFLAQYGPFFREDQETHCFVYTKLHQEFARNLEAAVSAWQDSKGMTEEHFESMLRHAKILEDKDTLDIADMLVHLLEYPTWVAYMIGLKKNRSFMEGLLNQYSEPGWESIGKAEIKWETQWWEQWSDTEWAQWRSSVGVHDSNWNDWSDRECDDWWSKQELRQEPWSEKKTSWADMNWLDMMAPAPPTPKAFNVVVPAGCGPGSSIRVTAPDGLPLKVTVPEHAVAGSAFAVSWLPN